MCINQLIVASVFLFIILVQHQSQSVILQPFFWNQTTFRSHQDNSLIFEVHLGDVMDLVCPFYNDQQSYITHELEQYDIYRVTEADYDLCSVDESNMDPATRLVITCNSPYDVMKYTLNFRSYLPIPNGLEFHSNQTYYFLSTSATDHQCHKLKINVLDHNRAIPTPSMNEHDRKSLLFPHRSDSSLDRKLNHRLLSHLIKVQRHSDPYSIKWITEGPNLMDKSSGTTPSMDTSNSPSQLLRLALTSSSSSQFSISLLTILCVLLLVWT